MVPEQHVEPIQARRTLEMVSLGLKATPSKIKNMPSTWHQRGNPPKALPAILS